MATALETLKRYWGYDAFRPLQEDIIASIVSGADTLGLMPTGGGKSLTFQVPTLMSDGLTLVVTPIISLMKDQVDNLVARRIKASYLHAGLTHAEMRRTIERCTYGNYKFLYVSPERLGSETFIAQLKQMPLRLIVVDEAHCISQWGYDFRPSFLKIAAIRKQFAHVPMLALTATATPQVVQDIVDKLDFKPGYKVFKKSFSRPNITYVVRRTESKLTQLEHILKSVPGTAIVYVRSRKRTKEIATDLCRLGIPSDFYHAGLDIEDKEDKQNKWKSGELRVIVATTAFGMGIDKPDVRLVVHVDVPNSLEEYYQEAGRAGRDGLRSWAVMLVSKLDSGKLKRHLAESFPDIDFIKRIYDLAGNFLQVPVEGGYGHQYEFNFNLFCQTYKLPVLPTLNALKILTRAEYLNFIEEIDTQSRVMILATKEDLYHINAQNPHADDVLNALLRSTTGVFADYVFINETVLARRFGISEQDIYDSLLELTRMHILHYIPRKRTPYIVYTTSREDSKYLVIPRAVYQDLQQRMEQRIGCVIDYATLDDVCRERRMLEYFGERTAGDCGHCDLCIERRKRDTYTEKDVRDGILYVTQVKPRTLKEIFDTLRFSHDEIGRQLDMLVDEGYVIANEESGTFTNPNPLG